MNEKNKIRQIEYPEYGLDSRYSSKEEYDSEASLLMEKRLKRLKKITKEQVAQAKLMQLKFKMESYLNQPVFDTKNYFSEFLKTYIAAIYPKNNLFAKDINITPIKLSQLINNHREPNDEFMMKLMIHSEKVYSNVCPFKKETWYQVFFHEKLCDTMSTQNSWRKRLEHDVQLSESIRL